VCPKLQVFRGIPTAVEAIKAGAADLSEKPLDKKSFVRTVESPLPENGKGKHVGELLTQGERSINVTAEDRKRISSRMTFTVDKTNN